VTGTDGDGGGDKSSGSLEPRVRKRRPKQYPLMTKPRRQLKKELTNYAYVNAIPF